MVIREASEADRQRWDVFVAAVPGGSFLQAWGWGEFQKELGVPYWRLVAEENERIIGVALVIKRELPIGKSWLYVPGGPLMTPEHLTLACPAGRLTLSSLEERGKEEGAIFMRIDPRLSEFNFSGGWKKAKREVQPKETLVMDLQKSAEELLAGMHQKTRYNIRLAEKHGVQIRFSRDDKDLEAFLQLSQAISARSPFRYHAPEYYRAMRKALGDMFEIAIAELNGQSLAVHLLILFGDTVTYVHGASSSEQREVMAPHLLQWESIKRGKAAGKHCYDFYGVGPAYAKATAGKPHRWAGITRFKEGFGGERRIYIGAHDYPLSPLWYFLYNLRH